MVISRIGFGATALVVALAVAPRSAEARTTGGGEIMTNDKVISLIKARLSEDLVIRMVKNASRTLFDVTVRGVLQLQEAGASESIIAAMMDIYQREISEHDRNVRIHIQMLRSNVSEEYDRAVRELVRYGSYAVPLLVENTTHEDERVRAGCLEVLGRIADPASIDAIFQSLLDRNRAVRAKAARAASMFDKAVVGPRRAAGVERRSTVRDGYALALGYLGDLAHLPLLLKQADDPGSDVDRAAASYALGLLGQVTPDVVRVLVEGVVNDAFRDLREASARALGRLAPRMDPATRSDVGAAMAKAVQRYASGRDILALQLRFVPSRRTVEVLLEFLGDRDRSVSSSCWEALKMVTGEDLPRDVEQWRGWWQIASSQPRWRDDAAGALTPVSETLLPAERDFPGEPAETATGGAAPGPRYAPAPEDPFLP
jgi:hypothetical protein